MQLRLKSVCDVCLGAGLLGCSLAVGQATRGRQVQAYEQLLYLLALRLTLDWTCKLTRAALLLSSWASLPRGYPLSVVLAAGSERCGRSGARDAVHNPDWRGRGLALHQQG